MPPTVLGFALCVVLGVAASPGLRGFSSPRRMQASPWQVKLPDTTLKGASINKGVQLPATLAVDVGDNIWIVGLVEGGFLKMVKIEIKGPASGWWIATRYRKVYSPSCVETVTFTMACFDQGEDPGKDLYPVGLKAGSVWQVKSPDTTLTGPKIDNGSPLPVTLKVDLGGNTFIVGLVEKGYLKMVKIQIADSTTPPTWMATRYRNEHEIACTETEDFTMDCFDDGEDAGTDMYPVSLKAELASESSIWQVNTPGTLLTGSSISSGNPLAVTVKVDFGRNIWIVGVVDGNYLKMVKIQITGPNDMDYTWIGTRFDNKYRHACTEGGTFVVECWDLGEKSATDSYPVSLKAEQAFKSSLWQVRTSDIAGRLSTNLTGDKISSGTPLPVTLKVDLGANIWIIGLVDDIYLKMVKIQIIDSTKYTWLGTRYLKDYRIECAVLATFKVDCFDEVTDPLENMYEVSLLAETKFTPDKSTTASAFWSAAEDKSPGEAAVKARITDNWPGIAAAVADAGISNANEFAMFIANIMQESAELTATTEDPSHYTSDSYDWGKCGKFETCPWWSDVQWCEANCKAHYFGRGYLQTTGYKNYKAMKDAGKCTKDGAGNTVDIVADPDKVATDGTLAWCTAAYYWKHSVHDNRCLNGKCDMGNTIDAINGALECKTNINGKGKTAPKRRFCYYKRFRESYESTTVYWADTTCIEDLAAMCPVR